ncbi:MAG: radical SAM protein [Eubacteriales bacterium]|nr:radical SAM protein [Oscillospiraceae bacterium]MDO4861403.1 radical SAM protein [Eubacteriales bacterium]
MKSIQTKSIMIQNLCAPCRNHCRYCLLSWDGNAVGTEWERSVKLAERYINELKEARPNVDISFTFGYSMEHSKLKEAIQTLKRLGSPMGEFLQCDGMNMRDEDQCRDLMRMLKEEGIKSLNFTAYGLRDYHDRFAGRKGDYDLLLRMMNASYEAGIPFTTGIPITKENIQTIDELVIILKEAGNHKISLFVPHEEGRGKSLKQVRLEQQDLSALSPESLSLLNRNIYRTESEWLSEPTPVQESNRLIIISLRADNIDNYDKRKALSVVEEVEALDEEYYSAFPPFDELAKEYGDPEGNSLYRIRDLYYHYRLLFAAEHRLNIYDVTDERLSGSRRY